LQSDIHKADVHGRRSSAQQAGLARPPSPFPSLIEDLPSRAALAEWRGDSPGTVASASRSLGRRSY
jgi:hypothetical protein